MQLYPALDIRGGVVTRSTDERAPVDVVRGLTNAGATWVHVVDLDAVFGTGDNLETVCEICRAAEIRVQVGGNLDDPRRIEAVVSAGASRVVLGTEPALDDGALATLQEAAGRAEVAVALEVCDGRVFLRSSSQTSDIGLQPFVRRIRDRGVSIIVYRDVRRDGALAGADFDTVSAVPETGVSFIYAGGVESLKEIQQARDAGLGGIIVGRALHERRFTVEEALACSA